MPRLLFALAILAVAAMPAAAGGPLERVVVTGADGERTTLAERVEPPAVLHFWATWCAPCLRELPEVAALADERPDLYAGLVLVSVDTAPYERVEAFLAERLELPALSSLKVAEGNAGSAFGITGYPTTVFIDGSGEVVRRHGGILDWSSEDVRDDLATHLSGGT